MSGFESMERMKELQEKYYSEHKKNTFFKNKQKFDCATVVCENIPLETLLGSTIFMVPESNRVCVDYMLFKMFAHPDNYQAIADNIIDKFTERIEECGDFQLHINLNTFTISALERYKVIIKYFCDKCLATHTSFSKKMDKMFIYRPPKSMDTIVSTLKPFIDPDVYGKIVLCKEDAVFPVKESK